MKKYGVPTVATLTVVALIAFLGCASVMDIATPAYIDPCSVEYAGEKATGATPFTNLWDARRVDAKMDFVHTAKQIDFLRLMEDDKLQYMFLKGGLTLHITAAEEFQAAVFSPTAPIGLMVTGLGFGTLGALLIKRPGDKSKKQIETENNKEK